MIASLGVACLLAAAGCVDLNSASEAELRRLPGIGAVEVSKILRARPFADPYDLVRRKILTASSYRSLTAKACVAAHPASARR
jgi:DNA uptake protein ComE-like DNA-binding protein